MRISYFCFVWAALAGMSGMALGLYMGIAEDHTLAPSHAHLNLLGWVTMMLYGLYHRGAPQDASALRWVQVSLGGAGFIGFAAGLGVYLESGSTTFFPVLQAGVIGCMASMALFIFILVRDAARLGLTRTEMLMDPSFGI